MCGKPCRITFLAFIFGDIPMGIENGYDKDDITNSIEYCKYLIEEGYYFEPHDKFNLKNFIDWGKRLIDG